MLRGTAAAQADRLALAGPGVLLAGAAWRLLDPDHGPWWALLALGLLGLGLSVSLRGPRKPGVWIGPPLGWMLGLGVWAMAGALAVEARVARLDAPMLAREIGPVNVEGWVLAVEAGESRPRMRLRVHAVEGMAKPPEVVRISPPAGSAIGPGRGVRCRAMLSPPGGPILPGAYDPSRAMVFQEIGAAGFSFGACRPVALPAPGVWVRAELFVAALRRDLAERLVELAPGPGGATAAAVLVGDRSFLSPEAGDAFQNSGLAHLLSVSGLHMGLAAGLAFAAAHAALAFVPGLALHWPVRKLAALAGLFAGAAYLVLTGASVPAQRAFVMTAAALVAVLLDRPAFTMRALAAAAVIITLLAPESVLDAGFQMSFAATAALVAWFEARKPPPPLPSPGFIVTGLDGLWRSLRAALMVSLIAGVAVDPIAAFHFQRFTLYGLPANLAASPIVSLLVAPAALLGAFTALLGWDGPLRLAAWGLQLIAGVGEAFGSRPEAVRWIPAAPPLALALMLGGMVWAAVWRGWLRWLGLPAAGAAVLLAITAPRPVLLVDGEARAALVRTDAGWRLWRAERGGRFAAERLAQRAGLDPNRLAAVAALPCGPHTCRWSGPNGVRGELRLPAPETGRAFEAALGNRRLTAARLRARGGAEVLALDGHLHVRHARDGEAPIWRRRLLRDDAGEGLENGA